MQRIFESFSEFLNEKIENWDIEEDQDCENYIKAKEWSLKNGYKLRDDVSYNGFIVIEKKFCLTSDPSTGHSLEINIYKDTNRKNHYYKQSDMVPEFGNIVDKTKYRLKFTSGKGANYDDKDLDVVFKKAIEREKELTKKCK